MKNKKQLDKLDTVIGVSTTMEGSIQTEGSIRIEGKVIGEINCTGDLTVGIDGVVEANIRARNIIVAGIVTGDVQASGTLHIEEKGKLQGNAQMDSFVIDQGGIFEGQSNMGKASGHSSEKKMEVVAE
ncbi:bactofilin family protein [Aquibacillus albus]|uniref:Cytoskeletal protein CcmA (Bactofilin family) n=1 Tax=Aquibacillus albus TaxID=1168171 RepID=A0ABS2N2X6_9BACI|nr:polymer-forming cytoskeletal protein [Aquibacillus albus]MBM7572499.1 cytoskeletal protein CcmA (bactofilin family) [Aquibacillus albus]